MQQCVFANLFQFLHQLDAVMETVDEGLVFVGYADPAAEIEYRIVVIQGQDFQIILQFFEAFPDSRWVGFVRFCVGAVQLIQHRLAIRIAGIKCMVLSAPFQ